MKLLINISFIIILPLISGCVGNPYTECYEEEARVSKAENSTTPEVIFCAPSEIKNIIKTRVPANYKCLGYSGFTMRGPSVLELRQMAREHAKKINADIAIVSIEVLGGGTSSIPMTTPSVSSSTTSYTGNAYGNTYGSYSGTAYTTTTGYNTTYMSVDYTDTESDAYFYAK